VIVLPALQGHHSSLLESVQAAESHSLNIITPRLRPCPLSHQLSLPCPLPNLTHAKGLPLVREEGCPDHPQIPTTALGSRVCTSWGSLAMPQLLCPREMLSLLGSPSLNHSLTLMLGARQRGNTG